MLIDLKFKHILEWEKLIKKKKKPTALKKNRSLKSVCSLVLSFYKPNGCICFSSRFSDHPIQRATNKKSNKQEQNIIKSSTQRLFEY